MRFFLWIVLPLLLAPVALALADWALFSAVFDSPEAAKTALPDRQY